MKIEVDQYGYLTGDLSGVGGLNDYVNNYVEMISLPDCNQAYFPAYRILSREIEKTINAYEEIIREETITVPVLDENGNDTGETEAQVNEYTEIVPVEKIIIEVEYYYELDEVKKSEIDNAIKNIPPEYAETPITLTDINNQLTDVQLALCALYERLEA